MAKLDNNKIFDYWKMGYSERKIAEAMNTSRRQVINALKPFKSQELLKEHLEENKELRKKASKSDRPTYKELAERIKEFADPNFPYYIVSFMPLDVYLKYEEVRDDDRDRIDENFNYTFKGIKNKSDYKDWERNVKPMANSWRAFYSDGMALSMKELRRLINA